MLKRLLITACFLLSSCGDNPFQDNGPIKDTNYAQIRLEMQRCDHIESEGSFSASMRWAPKTDCLKHLQKRIVETGKSLDDKAFNL